MEFDSVPITVFTGFLGAGKTSLILSLLRKLPSDYRVALIKNEYGLTEVDSQLAQQSSISGVTEVLNGCLCCVLVGQLETAIIDALLKYRPNRIIVETSGSSFPGPIAWQINEMRSTTGRAVKVHLDAIITVVDCVNFCGYEDTSYTAKLQAQYSDLILLNKWADVTERQLDLVVDHVNTLNTNTPKVKTSPDSISLDLIMSVDRRLLDLTQGSLSDLSHMENEVEVKTITSSHRFLRSQLENALDSKKLEKDIFYRIKGYAELEDHLVYIVNWAFGRWDGFTETAKDFCRSNSKLAEGQTLKLTIMGNDFGNLRKLFSLLLETEDFEIN